ncbi:DUF6064 family protein [Anaeromyxobacter oryzae]|uniref:MFS transporter permease n=1 Tax=Anaeromyxobacter oryzae TaxID=2918170 RepID=A0ABM7WP87_9BACT|nr:DUF6064 family protein [Anaeromyxobacter oryzae]BDG01264.1 hypothetical protein AMOR_02600 [Anaeromyxobacter oryzae]
MHDLPAVRLPFTVEQFFEVFARYGAAIWPAQLVAYALGLLCLAAVVGGGRRTGRAVLLVLAAFWAAAGAGYHLGYFRRINPTATGAGLLFLLEAALLVRAALPRDGLSFRLRAAPRVVLGLVFAGYALAVYPLLNLAAGRGLTASPAFGVTPCPVTIFTFAMFLLADRHVPWTLVAIPLLWSVVGLAAALQLRVPADYGLAVAGVVGTVVLASGRRTRRVAAPLVR